MQLEIGPEGEFTFRQLPPLYVEILERVPEVLSSDDPRVRDRLHPDTYADPEEQRKWRALAGTELEHLFAGRREIIQKDLRSLAEDSAGGLQLVVPRPHVQAWLAGLNAARLTLFILHDLSPDELEMQPGSLGEPERDMALLQIYVMAFFQEMLLEATEQGEPPPPPGARE